MYYKKVMYNEIKDKFLLVQSLKSMHQFFILHSFHELLERASCVDFKLFCTKK